LKCRGIRLDIEAQLSKKYGISREELIRAIEREKKFLKTNI